jgi:hypothetical protein
MALPLYLARLKQRYFAGEIELSNLELKLIFGDEWEEHAPRQGVRLENAETAFMSEKNGKWKLSGRQRRSKE